MGARDVIANGAADWAHFGGADGVDYNLAETPTPTECREGDAGGGENSQEEEECGECGFPNGEHWHGCSERPSGSQGQVREHLANSALTGATPPSPLEPPCPKCEGKGVIWWMRPGNRPTSSPCPDCSPLEPHNDPGITGYRLPLEPQEDGCNHEPWDQQTAMVADGMCPLCLSAKLDTLRSDVERLKNSDSFYLDEVAENKRLTEKLEAAEEINATALDENRDIRFRIASLEQERDAQRRENQCLRNGGVFLVEQNEALRAERDAAIKAHDDMKECLGRKLKEAIAERDALLAEVERLDGELRFVVNLIDANPNAYGSDLQDCLMHPRAALSQSPAPSWEPTVAELQAQIGRLQSKLALKVLGDPRKGVSFPAPSGESEG